MHWLDFSMVLVNLAFLAAGAAYLRHASAIVLAVPTPRARLVHYDGSGPIVGKPTRAQWRLRRRSLEAAAAICEGYAEQICEDCSEGAFSLRASASAAAVHARECGSRIRDLILRYDRESPDFACGNRQIAVADKVA